MTIAGTPPSWNNNTDDLIRQIDDALGTNEKLAKHLPGLKSLLDDYLNDDVEVRKVEFHRRLLRVFRDAPQDNTYQNLLAELQDDEKTRVEKFVADDEPLEKCSRGFDVRFSLGVREHLKALLQSDTIKVSGAGPVHIAGLSNDELKLKDRILHSFVHGLAKLFPCLKAGIPDEVIVYKDARFQNWGLNVDNVPVFTCIPSSVVGVQRIVKYAKEHDLSVRCAGFRHSWAPIFGRSGQILISLLGLHEATVIPNITAFSFLPQDGPTELESIEVVKGTPRQKGNVLVRIGSATTNERLRRWCVENKKYTLPLNVIMVEMTLGGTNGPICHGSGRDHPTLSDLVRKVEYVDANGKLRVVDNPEHLKAASGCFGLMGVITHLTLELCPMTYAQMEPKKIPTIRAIPPPPDMKEEDIPPALRLSLTPEQRKHDQEEFEKHALNDFYSEWFWFPLSDHCWVNCWNNTTDSSGAEDYPDAAGIFFSFIAQFTLNVLQFAPALHELIDELGLNEAAVVLISRAALIALPDDPIKTFLPDALHFQRGIQNVRVLNMEVEMPLVPQASNPSLPDWEIVQRAWWDAILTCYAHTDTCPQRMPLEMRIMGGSNVTMAAQRGNTLGTCSIEILTLYAARDDWIPYAQEVLDKWMSYKDSQGKKLRTRPHWAKQWYDFKVDGKPWPEKLKNEDYKDAIVEFKSTLGAVGQEHGWTLADLKHRFSNDFFDWFYFDDI